MFIFGSSSANAAPDITADVPLDFGLVAVKNNDSVSTLSISHGGAVTFVGDVIPIGGAMRGEYNLTGFPANVMLDFTWIDGTLSAGGLGLPELLQVTDYENPVTMSDTNGEASVPVGASLKTNGSSVMYGDATYTGDITVRVRYWSPPDVDYLIFQDTVVFTAELQSSINLIEDQVLTLGSVAAYTDPVLTATMVLGTDGKISSIVNAGTARITTLGGALAGVVRVSGAAPNYGVTITPEAGSIFLTHTLPGDLARFIVKDFVTSPTNPDGRTDSNGDLVIKIGATLETEATSKIYENGTYNGTYDLTVSY
ncbi:DUF4402 domain-containing protein [Pseudomonadota bacterium]